MLIATACAWVTTTGKGWQRHIVFGYVEVIRNTPFLLQLYFFFFGLPAIGIRLPPTQAALLTMVVNLGVYAVEIMRAGVESVPHGQTEAGRALGLRPLQIFRLIILPPTLSAIYQPLAAQFTMVLLGSSVTSAISANELTSAANSLQSINFRTFETYLVVTFMYLLMVFAFCLYASAFLGDIWHGSVLAVPPTQWEASRSLALSWGTTLRLVILPQAARIAVPPTIGFLVQLIKSTSLASIIGFVELVRAGQFINNATLNPLYVYGFVACVFFALCWPISKLSAGLETRLNRGFQRTHDGGTR